MRCKAQKVTGGRCTHDAVIYDYCVVHQPYRLRKEKANIEIIGYTINFCKKCSKNTEVFLFLQENGVKRLCRACFRKDFGYYPDISTDKFK